MANAGEIFIVGRESQERLHGILPNQHRQVPAFVLGPDKIIAACTRVHELAAAGPKKGQGVCGRIEWTVAASHEWGISGYQREGANVREDGQWGRLGADGLANLAWA